MRPTVALIALSALVAPAIAQGADSVSIDALEAQGLGSTKVATLVELLPRELPAQLTAAEIAEFTRRVKNLALFDAVKVEVVGRVLRVTVRRKASISPIVDFSSGKTLADSKVTLGAIENDVDGRGTRLGAKASYNQRGLNFAVWLNQHPYGPRRWMNEAEVYYLGSSFRFEPASPDKWHRNRFGGFLEFLSPFVYGSRLRYEVQAEVYRETYSGIGEASRVPRPGTYVGGLSELIWDAYTWNDLTPNGLRWSVELRPGVFLGAAQPRHEVRGKVLGAIKLGTQSVFVGLAQAAAVNGGNVNHSLLVGSQSGVRGLADSLYRAERFATLNLELRHALSLGNRWYLQGVFFTDAARFQPMDALGNRASTIHAINTGVGVRILPTALVDTLLRFDVARLHAPDRAWFLQFGISQYI